MFLPFVTLLLVCCASLWAGASCWLLLAQVQIRRSAGRAHSRQGQGQRDGEQRVFIPLAQHTGLLLASSMLAIVVFIVILMPGYLSYLPLVDRNEDIVILLVRVQILIVGMTAGSMLAFALIYLPALRRLTPIEKARFLSEISSYHLKIILTGVVLATITAILEVLLSRSAWAALPSLPSPAISYNQILALEIVLLCVLLIFSVVHLKIAYPQLQKALRKYTYILHRVKAAGVARGSLLEQLKQREARLVARTQFLRTIARCEAVTGIGLLLVGSLAYAITGTATLPVPVTQQSAQTTQTTVGQFTTMTTDNQFKLTLIVSPNHYGPNVFTVSILENGTGNSAALVDVSLSLTMLDMNMGTDTLHLLPNGPNRYSGTGNLSMTGNWAIRILIRTQDNRMHEAQVKLLTPY